MYSTGRLPRLAALFIAVTLTACEDEAAETVERIRAIKPYYVVEPAGGAIAAGGVYMLWNVYGGP
jgi:hypothetical protein